MKVWKEFTFEAAHSLPGEHDSPFNPNGRLHGHSYKARVYLEGKPVDGMVLHMNDLERAVEAVRFRLDHHNLNDVLVHARPTLETIAEFIAVSFHVGKVVRVDVWRPTCGDGAWIKRSNTWRGAAPNPDPNGGTGHADQPREQRVDGPSSTRGLAVISEGNLSNEHMAKAPGRVEYDNG